MSLYEPSALFPAGKPRGKAVDNGEEIPKEWDVFYKSMEAFLPAGKTIDDLTPEELKKIKSQYRFDPYSPGIYQGITGFGHML
jgi:hypothetical protein